MKVSWGFLKCGANWQKMVRFSTITIKYQLFISLNDNFWKLHV